MALVSGSRETPVWCMVYDDLDYSHEADIFANQMKFVKPLIPYEIFMANIEAGNDKQLMIRDLVESYGMIIGSSKKPGAICAVSTLEYIFDKHGYHALDRVLRLIIGAWEGDFNSFSANIMKAVAKLVMVYKESLDDDLFKEKLGAISIKQLTRNAKERRAGFMGYAEVMVLEYNGKKKSNAAKLPLNALFAKDYSGLDNIGEDDEFYEVNDDALFQNGSQVEELTLDENLNDVNSEDEEESGDGDEE